MAAGRDIEDRSPDGLTAIQTGHGTSCEPHESAHGEDIRLAAAVLRKDRKATAEFVSRHADRLYAYLRRRLTPREDLADDLLQEVFLAAWESLPEYAGRSTLQSWMFGIARHKVEAHYRARLREPLPLDDEDGPGEAVIAVEADFDERIDVASREARTGEILRELPETYAMVLLWRYWEQRSAAEMAAATGKTEKAIERLLARAREQFRRRWNRE
jgi:RNA polymerase sigma-70 factor (ECF subfamily)